MGDIEHDGHCEETRWVGRRVSEDDGYGREHGEVDFNHRGAVGKRRREGYLKIESYIVIACLHAY